MLLTDSQTKRWFHLRVITASLIFLQCNLVSGRFLEAGEHEGFEIPSDPSEAYRSLISRAFQQHKSDPSGALQILSQAETIFPKDAGAIIARSKILMLLSRHEEAKETLEIAIKMDGKNPKEAKFDLDTQLDSAVIDFISARVENLLEMLATLRFQTGDFAGAQEDCIRWASVKLDARSFYIYGISILSSDSWRSTEVIADSASKALKTAARLSATTEEQAKCHFALGILLSRSGDFVGARTAFQITLRRNPYLFEAWMRCGEMSSRLGVHAQAFNYYRIATTLRPTDAEAHIQAGNALRRQNVYDEAFKLYRNVQRLPGAKNTDVAEALYQIASVKEKQGSPVSAKKAYMKSLKHDPHHARSLNNLASLLIATDGLSQEATSFYRRAVKADPGMFEAYNNLGGNLLLEGHAGEAIEFLEFGMSMERSEPQLHFNLGLAYRKVSPTRSKEAVSYMRNALRLNPKNKDYYWELARTYNYLNQSKLMLSVLDGMTRTLRSGWGSVLNENSNVGVDEYIHHHSRFLVSEPKPEIQQAENAEKRNEAPSELQSAVILFLCCADADELRDLHFSLAALHKFFSNRYKYPVVILHDRLNSSDMVSLSSAFSSPELLQFKKIKLDFPRNMSKEDRAKIPKHLHLAGHQWSLGYRHMSNFFCDDIFELDLFQQYEYYWRLDADSFILTDIRFDVFQRMASERKIYGYMVITQEDASVVDGLWEVTQKYISNSGLEPKSLKQHLTEGGNWNRNMFYTNFEISRFDFWRSKEFRDFWNEIQQSQGVYYKRWGDAPIHLLAVSLLLEKNDVREFRDVSYWHQYYVNLP